MPLTDYDRDLNNAMEAHFTCPHEDVQLECPFCQRVVDEDTLVCLTCKEMVAGVRTCVYCGEAVPEPTPSGRTIPPHFHAFVETDQRHTDTGDWVKRCTICQHEV